MNATLAAWTTGQARRRGGVRAGDSPGARTLLKIVIPLALVALAGCGRKGPPVAPEVRLPLPPSEVRATVGPGEITLTWKNPTRRADNRRLRDLAAVRIYRVGDSGVGEPRPAILEGDKVIGYTELIEVRIERPEPAVIEGGRGRLVDRAGLKDGQRYTYVLTASDFLGRTSAPSQRVSILFITAPKPPVNLTGIAGERQVELTWEPSPSLSDGSPLAGAITYQVLRASSPTAVPTPVTLAPIGNRQYTDRDLENEQTYFYSVQAVRADVGSVAVGEPSSPIALTPRKMTPPAPPSGLIAIASADAVRLAWEASPEADVAGYVIYRAAGNGDMVRIARVTVPTTVFVDRAVAAGPYRYAVSAFDRASRPNESGRSAEVRVTVR